MRKVNSKIEDIISQIQQLKGQHVSLEVSRGRRKSVKFSGIIESVYPSIFTVKSSEDDNVSKTYSYADVMCGDVKFFPEKQGNVIKEIKNN